MKSLSRTGVIVLTLLTLLLTIPASAEQISVSVALRPGVTADVAVRIFTNPNPPAKNLDVLVVHGLAQTGATFDPLAQALFSDHMGDKVARVLILDLPGHGRSPLPAGMAFGDLALEDYTTAVVGVLGALPSDGFDPHVVVAHSMGAIIVQMAQERLAAQGTTLRESFGVRGAVLIAPVIPANLPWVFVDSGAAAGILGSFLRFEPGEGLIVDFPPPAWLAIFYSDRAGSIVSGSLTPDQASANGYISHEAFVAGAQTIRLFAPAFVRAGLFGSASGTVAGVISLEQDLFFAFPSEHRGLYEYATGDHGLKLFFPLSGPTTVHNMHTIDPAPLLHPIKKVINSMDQ